MAVEDARKKKLKYPKSVFFIISNEFCERFSYYGMRTILALYLKSKLGYSDDASTVIYHVFTMFVYFFPLFGAMLADSLLGKFRTILYLSVVYATGQLILSASAVPTFELPIREFSLFGLLLIAMGTGGIKPCVAAFGGDQFILPQQEKYLVMFFSVFYFAINSGSLISTFLTPKLRSGVKCFDEQVCYSVAFLVPAILMIVSIVIFVLGKRLYRMKKPEGNVVLNVIKCTSHAIYNKTTQKKGDKIEREHWLDHADDKYDGKLIGDIKAALQVLKLFIPLPFFWALFDQQGSRWTFQATRMDGQIGGFLLEADQMQVVNPLFILLFIPIFETCIYPAMAKIKLIDTPLKKLTAGGFLAAVAFVASAIVELQLEKTYPVLPSEGLGQLRLFNPTNCSVKMTLDKQSFKVQPYEIWEDIEIIVNGTKSFTYTADFSACDDVQKKTGTLEVVEKQAMSYVIDLNGPFYGYKDANNKTDNGNPGLRVLAYNPSKNEDKKSIIVRVLQKKSEVYKFAVNTGGQRVKESEVAAIASGTYEIEVNGVVVSNEISMKLGGVYTLITHISDKTPEVKLLIVTPPNSVHILWLIPQYIIITMAEVMFSVTGLEFAFTQAPVSMKSLLQAGWLMTVAFGNLIVVIVAEAKFFDRQVHEFLLFAALMAIDMVIFSVMAYFYKYADLSSDNDSLESETETNIPLDEDAGQANGSFTTKDER